MSAGVPGVVLPVSSQVCVHKPLPLPTFQIIFFCYFHAIFLQSSVHPHPSHEFQESRISALEAKLEAALKLLVCKSMLRRNRRFNGGAQW